MKKTQSTKEHTHICRRQLFLLFLTAVFLICASVYIGINWDNLFQKNKNGNLLEMDPNAADMVGGEQRGPTDTAGGLTIQLPGYDKLRLIDGRQIHAALENPESNPCYFIFTIQLESGAVLFRSKLVPPGKAISAPMLTKKLDPGHYPATIRIETFSLDSQTPMNGANIKTVLIAPDTDQKGDIT